MTEGHFGIFGIGHLATKTFDQLSQLYSSTKEHNMLTKLALDTTESVAKGIYHRIIGGQSDKLEAEIDTPSADSKMLNESILDQLSMIEKRHPLLVKGSSYTLAISKKLLEEVATVSAAEGKQTSQLVNSVHQLASRTLKTFAEVLEKAPEAEHSRCNSEGHGLIALCEVVKAVSDDLWDITTKEILLYNPSKLVHETVEDAYDKAHTLTENATVQLKNITASAVDEVSSAAGKVLELSEGTINCMTELVSKLPLMTQSAEYLHGLADGVKCLPLVSATVEGLSLFKDYVLTSQPSSMNDVLELPEVNVVFVEEEDFHFIPQLPVGRRIFFVFIGAR